MKTNISKFLYSKIPCFEITIYIHIIEIYISWKVDYVMLLSYLNFCDKKMRNNKLRIVLEYSLINQIFTKYDKILEFYNNNN